MAAIWWTRLPQQQKVAFMKKRKKLHKRLVWPLTRAGNARIKCIMIKHRFDARLKWYFRRRKPTHQVIWWWVMSVLLLHSRQGGECLAHTYEEMRKAVRGLISKEWGASTSRPPTHPPTHRPTFQPSSPLAHQPIQPRPAPSILPSPRLHPPTYNYPASDLLGKQNVSIQILDFSRGSGTSYSDLVKYVSKLTLENESKSTW